MIRRVAVFAFAIVVQLHLVKAQVPHVPRAERAGEHVSEYQVGSLPGVRLLNDPTQEPFTSVVIRLNDLDTFESARLVAGKDTFRLQEDPHYNGPGKNSTLVVFGDAFTSVLIELPYAKHPYSVFLISAPALAGNQRKLGPDSADASACEEPQTVSQDEWRQGLAAPVYNRSFTQTEHLIVHHSATSNSLTDYYNVVRNIYLYHTQVNGWSDIGYNYLIAPDGTIFKGRDPGPGDQDLVLGAHFCGRNSTTMGVCVLGDYRFIEPSAESVSALESLLSWKAYKEGMDVLAEKDHPLNGELPVIAGHRQGCATECPGDELFNRLDDVRLAVHENILACSDELVSENLIVYPNPASEELMIEVPEGTSLESLALISLSGQVLAVGYVDEGQGGYKVQVSQLRPGVYITRIELIDEEPIYKKIIIL